MVSRSEMKKDKNSQIIRNDHMPPPKFRNTLNIETPIDTIATLSSIPPRVLTIQDIRSCYQCKIKETRYFEIRNSYDKLCINKILKDEFKIIVDKGLMHALVFPKVFKNEWIKIVLN